METPNGLADVLPAVAWPRSQSFVDINDQRALAQAIVDTIREPLLVLDKDLRVLAANRSFYLNFRMNCRDVQGRPVYELGDGQWDITELRLLLGNIAPQHSVMEAYEVEQDFIGIGRRTMMLNARELFYKENSHTMILLTIEDITERRANERALKELLQQKEVLLQEIQHRVANSLQIIASIFLMKARTVRSEETRLHLQDAHQRVMSVAAMQQQLQASEPGAPIKLGLYLSRLCETLAASMIGDRRPISLEVRVAEGIFTSNQAVSIGLIVTELVINAFKHAFPAVTGNGRVVVAYESAETNWKLSVSDNGVGMPAECIGGSAHKKSGLGTSIVKALANQLDAQLHVSSGPTGTAVSITHATFGPEPVTA